MNVDELVRDTLRETAEAQAAAPPGFADRVLAVRRRRHRRRIAAAAVGTAAVLALGLGVQRLDSGRDEVRPAAVLDDGATHAHPDQSPPRDLVAAGDVALAAYYTVATRPQGDQGLLERTYWLLDPATGRYEQDDRWSYVAVAPGLRTAAVLERTWPALRVGVLDLATGKVVRWIPVRGDGIGGIAYSQDGTKLVATTYAENPDLLPRRGMDDAGEPAYFPGPDPGTRTGFMILDPDGQSGGARFGAPDDQLFNPRSDFRFSRDGRLVYAPVIGDKDGMQQYYDLTGEKVAAPAEERHLRSDVEARLSPNGALAASGLTEEKGDRGYSSIRDPRSGKEITRVRGGELLAWVDDRRLIAWERSANPEVYEPRLVLVTIGSDEVTRLSGVRKHRPDSRWEWEPVFARR
ncbi:WD40 repeat domain-containing protein [Streptomyces sp. NPDC003832]